MKKARVLQRINLVELHFCPFTAKIIEISSFHHFNSNIQINY
jgi:hypothetical protein